jgi:hypothetical protein
LDEVQEAALEDILNLSSPKVQFDLNESVPPEFAKTSTYFTFAAATLIICIINFFFLKKK